MSGGLPAVLGLVAAASVPAAGAADLVVDVAGLSSDSGAVHYAVYDDPARFPGREGRIAKGSVPVSDGRARFFAVGLKPGAYAVAVFHDENGNGEFDQGLFGIPLESYGFSNGATAFFGPPSFADAAVQVGPEGATITIRVD